MINCKILNYCDEQCLRHLTNVHHCHNKNNQCIPFIEDCQEHRNICIDGCHEEHGCLEP